MFLPVLLVVAVLVAFGAVYALRAQKERTAKATAPEQPSEAPRDAAPGPYSGMVGAVTSALRTKTLANMRRLATACQAWMAEHEDMPESLDEIVKNEWIGPEGLRDGWAHLIRYERLGPTRFRLSSDGLDGVPGTADDIVIENGSVVQGDIQLPGAPTSRQMQGLDPPPRPQDRAREVRDAAERRDAPAGQESTDSR
jgi:hypothetical protein